MLLLLTPLALEPFAWPDETATRAVPASPAPLGDRSITVSPRESGIPARPSAEERFNAALKLYRSGDCEGAASAALETAKLFPGTHWEGRTLFLAGRAYASKGDVDSAARTFGLARHKYPALADYSLYLLAGLYYKASRYGEAARTYLSLVSGHPGSLLVSDSLLKAGDCNIKLGLFADAVAPLKRFIEAKGPSPNAAEGRYMLMEAYASLGKVQAAYDQYRTLWLDCPYSADSEKAEGLMKRLVEAGFIMPRPGLDDYSRRAGRLFDGGHYKSASAEYKKAFELSPEGSAGTGEILLKLGLCHYHLRENDRAEYFMRQVVENPRFSKYAPEALFWLARTYLRTGDEERLHGAAIRCALEYPDDRRAVDCLYLLGASYSSDGDYDIAIGIFNTLLDSSPDSERADEFLWQLGWANFEKGEYKASEEAFKRLSEGYHGSELVPQAIYWRARALEAMGRREEAGKCYDKAIREHGLSFYASLAMNAHGQPAEAGKKASVPPPGPRLMPKYSDPALARAVELGIQGMDAEGVRELKPAEKRYDGSLEDAKVISGVYGFLGEYQRPLEIASGLYENDLKTGRGTIPGDALEMLFPLAFWDMVRDRAAEFGIDPFLVYSVIRAESRFNPETVSPAGAVGLMQLMPGTAVAVCRRLGVPYVSPEQLKDEGFNIPVGVRYLKSLMDKHEGRLVYVLAEYNAGPVPLAHWIEKDPGAPDDVFIEGIGYYETRGYVKRVLRNYYLYKKIYEVKK